MAPSNSATSDKCNCHYLGIRLKPEQFDPSYRESFKEWACMDNYICARLGFIESKIPLFRGLLFEERRSSFFDSCQDGHLYGAIIHSIRDYIQEKRKGKYGEYHLAFCAHYVADLSMPLHNTVYNAFNRKNHSAIDGIINDEVLDNLDKIRIYPITIDSEDELVEEIARIANLSMALGYKIEAEDRLLTGMEAYQQISHSASLFRAIQSLVDEKEFF